MRALVVSLLVSTAAHAFDLNDAAPLDGGAAAQPRVKGTSAPPVEQPSNTRALYRDADPAPAESTFAAYWNAQGRAELAKGLRQTCTAEARATDASLCIASAGPLNAGQWCACFTAGPQRPALVYDLPLVLESKVLLMAAWIVDPMLVKRPLLLLHALSAENAAPVPDRLRPSSLGRFAGLESFNADTTVRDASLGLLPGASVSALADRVFAGLEKAVEARAEQEATAFVLEQIQNELCSRQLPPGAGSVREWLPTTCAVADAGGFSGGPGSGGLASLALLQRSLEADLRTFPGRAARTAVEAAAVGPRIGLASAAGPVQRLVDDLAAGMHPARALDNFGSSLEGSTDADVGTLACLATLPGAQARAATAVEEANRGLRPGLGRNDAALVALLVAFSNERCRSLLATPTPTEAVAAWTQHLPEFVSTAADVASAMETFGRAAPAGAEERSPHDFSPVAANVTAALDVLQPLTRILSKVAPQGASRTKVLRDAVDAARSLSSMVVAVDRRDMTAVFQQVLLHNATDGASCAQQPCFAAPRGLLKYGGLLVAIAGAKDADAVKAAVLAASTPAGTWRTKYRWEAQPVVTLGGVLGFGGQTNFAGAPAPRVLVPLGVDLSLLQWKYLSVGVFLQLLDLAGYSSYVNAGGVIRPWQALSPGGSLRIGLFGSPVVLLVGGGYDVDTGGPTAAGGGWFRFGIGIDATLFLLHRS